MKTSEHFLVAKAKNPPVITYDAVAGAAYIYFQKPTPKIARTINRVEKGGIINVDIDRNNEVVGIEAIGFSQIKIEKLIHKARVNADAVDFSRATLLPA